MKRTDILANAKRLAVLMMSVILVFGLTPLAAIADDAGNAKGAGSQNSLAPANGALNKLNPQDAHVHDGITFNEWTATDSLPTAAGNYYLSNNVTLTAAWNVPAGGVALCLNGHEIKQTAANTCVISVPEGKTLDLYDEAGNAGKITGGGQGGVMLEGAFVMHGGTISENTAIETGGGVCVDRGTFVMAGGVITKNEAPECGGGVYVNEGTFSISGDIQLSGNKSPDGNDVYLHDGRVIEIVGEVSAKAPISVATRTAPTAEKPVTITAGLSDEGAVTPDKLFASESEKTLVSWDAAQKEAVLAVAVTVTFDANGGQGAMAPQKVAAGIPAKLQANTFKRERYVFDCWCTDRTGASGTRYADGATATFSANTMLYATWKLTDCKVEFFVDDKIYDSQTVPYGSTVDKPEDPKKSGYRFVGWYDSSLFGAKKIDSTALYDFSAPVKNSELKLNALWEEAALSSVRVNEGAPNVKALNLEDVARATLSKDEIAKGAKFQLVVSPLKLDAVPRADAQALAGLERQLGVKTGVRFDISIFKTVGDGVPVAVTKTAVPVEFEVEVPNNVLEESAREGYATEFFVLSSHEGTAETHKSYQNDDFLVFRKDHFSTYEIAYKQVPKDQVQPSQSSSSSSSSSTKATGGTAKSGSSSAKSTTPKTGDNGLLVGAVCSLLLASACVLAIARRRVK